MKFRVKKDGTKIVEPDTRLKEKIGKNVNKLITQKNIDIANNFIAQEAKNFPEEIRLELRNLDQLFITYNNEDFSIDKTKSDSQNFIDMLNQILNIKSSSAIYGYNLATNIARLLFEYCDNNLCTSTKQRRIIQLHINALKIMYKQDIKGDGGQVGKQLISELQLLVKKG